MNLSIKTSYRALKRVGAPLLNIALLAAVIPVFAASCNQRPGHSFVAAHDRKITVDVSGLKEGIPAFFSTELDGCKVDFFLVRTGGEIRSYLDACRKCYIYGKGYRAMEGYVVCGYCNVKYPVDEIASGIGSCMPVYLKGSSENGSWVILREDIDAALAVIGKKP